MNYFLEDLKKVKPILDEIIQIGGIPYLVGGSVRDLVLGRQIKDVDIEVHKLTIDELQNCLKKFGPVRLVGKKFGVLRIDGFDIDWSLPRSDSKGRKPETVIDPDMTIQDALKRRDLTMNAMAIDLRELIKQVKIIDPYGGLQDIKNKILRAVDIKLFLDDPLRFFRVMQFIGRFEMEPDKELNDLCKKMDLKDAITGSPVSKERIFEEIKKLLLKSKKPSLGFRWLQKTKRLKEIFPELYDLIGVQQRKDYHPEGDVFEHTMQSIDAAAVFDEYENKNEKFLITIAALVHDLGKVVATDKDLSCYGHEKAGVPIAKKLLKRITNNQDLIQAVCKLVRYHVRPAELLKQKSGIKAYKRLALKLAPYTNLRQLAILNLVDLQGRNPKGSEPLVGEYKDRLNEFLKKMREVKIEKKPEEAVLQGRDLLDIIPPGPKLGLLVKKAYKIQIDEGVKDKEELKKRILKEK